MRFAFVVSEVYPDLYVDTFSREFKDIIFSSRMRSGPISFFTDLNSDFFIVKNDEYSTNLWREKVDCCGLASYDYYDNLSGSVIEWRNNSFNKSQISVSASSIDWSRYDFVICVDACVSSTITSKYPKSIWAYYVSEGGMPEAKYSRNRPYDGYSVFLNQRFRRDDYFDDPNLPHEIDFPYHFMSTSSMRKLIGDACFSNKSGIFIEKDTRKYLSDADFNRLEKYGPVRVTGGTIDILLKDMAASKYFLRLGDKPIWGNASIEAAACEALQITSERGYRNRIFCFKENSVGGVEFSDIQFNEAIERLNFFEENPQIYENTLRLQSIAVNEICFNKPYAKLLDKVTKKFSFPS